MTIDNGVRRRLIIPRVFDGLAGVSDGKVAFLPLGRVRDGFYAGTLEDDQGALLPVRLAIQREGRGPVYSATYSD